MNGLPLVRPPTSIPEVVELLRHEFDSEFTRCAVSAVVSRLSANGAVSVPVLEHLGRIELRKLLAVGCSAAALTA